jgi:hypothetical protein
VLSRIELPFDPSRDTRDTVALRAEITGLRPHTIKEAIGLPDPRLSACWRAATGIPGQRAPDEPGHNCDGRPKCEADRQPMSAC